MPTPVLMGVSRPTIDLHAPWWDATRTEDGTTNTRTLSEDEPGGRYLERWVVYAHMTERDEQQVAAAMKPRIQMHGGGTGKASRQEIIMQEMPFARLNLLLQMTREVTDANGQPLHLSKDLISSFESKDTKWVEAEMERLYQRDSSPILEEDEQESARLTPLAEEDGGRDGRAPRPEEVSPRAIADRAFRSGRQTRAQG